MLDQIPVTVEVGAVTGANELELLDDLEQELIARYRGTPGESYADVDPTRAEQFTPPNGTFRAAGLWDVVGSGASIKRRQRSSACS